jgi:hypothetical protein
MVRKWFVSIMVLLVSVVSVSAQQPPRPDIFVLANRQLVGLAPNDPTQHHLGSLADSPLPEDEMMGGSPEVITPEISPDGKWLANTVYYPGMVIYGQRGSELQLVNPPDDEFQGLWTIFSPDSRYLSYTLASYSAWKLGFVDLTNGKKVEFQNTFAFAPHEIVKSNPFGDMVPNAVHWSADGRTLYLETTIPFLGCRGPHDLYALDFASINFDDSNPALPPAREVTTLGGDIFDFVFSPDEKFLAYAYEEDSCGAEQPHAVGYVDLTTGENHVIAEHDEARWFIVGDWTNDSRFLLYAAHPQSGERPTVMLYDTTIAQSGEMFSDLTGIEAGETYWYETMLTGVSSLFSIVNTYSGSVMLYSGSLSDGQVVKNYLSVASGIKMLRCDNTLYYVEDNSTAKLYSRTMNDAGSSTLLLEADYIQLLSCGTLPG